MSNETYDNDYDDDDCDITFKLDDEYKVNTISYATNNKSILNDMNKLTISDDIKNKANEIYVRNGFPNHRGFPRKLMIFAYIYQAHMELNIQFIPIIIANQLDISQNKIQSAMAFITDEKYDIIVKSPLDYVDYFMNVYKLDKIYKNNITNLINNIPQILILDNLPYIITLIAVNVYCESIGIKINIDEIINLYNINITKYKTLFTKINAIFNNL